MQTLPIADYSDYINIQNALQEAILEIPAYLREGIRFCEQCGDQIMHDAPAHFCTKKCHRDWINENQVVTHLNLRCPR